MDDWSILEIVEKVPKMLFWVFCFQSSMDGELQQPRLVRRLLPRLVRMMYGATCAQGKRPLTASPRVKAGLMWLPETLPNIKAGIITPYRNQQR